MTDDTLRAALARFDQALSSAAAPDAAWRALEDLAAAVAGFKLFTVMTVDMAHGVARRAYSSHPMDYPVSGTKPVERNVWFDIVHGEKRTFIANTIADIAKVFPDHQKIWAMGCGSVVNLPVVLGGELAATINLLHEEHYYDDARVTAITRYLTQPAAIACQAARAPS